MSILLIQPLVSSVAIACLLLGKTKTLSPFGARGFLTRFHPTCQPSQTRLVPQLVLAANGYLRGSILCQHPCAQVSGASLQVVFAGFMPRGLAVSDPLSLRQCSQLLVLVEADEQSPRLGRGLLCLTRIVYTRTVILSNRLFVSQSSSEKGLPSACSYDAGEPCLALIRHPLPAGSWRADAG